MDGMTMHKIRPELAELIVPIDLLTPHPRNPNNGDVEAIAESLQAHGQYRPIVVRDVGTADPAVILAGNTTYAAALSLGWTDIAVTWVTCDEQEATRILIADNAYARRARMDRHAEVELLLGLPDLIGTGVDDDELAAMMRALDVAAVLPIGVDDEPDDRADARSGRSGLRTAELILPAADHAELHALAARLRQDLGEHSLGETVLRAARMAVAVLDGGAGHHAGCDCPWCGVRRAVGR